MRMACAFGFRSVLGQTLGPGNSTWMPLGAFLAEMRLSGIHSAKGRHPAPGGVCLVHLTAAP